MDALYTTSQAAEKIGASVRTVHRLAEKHGIGFRLGVQLAFSARDIPRLAEHYQGRAGAPAGNDFWTRRKPKSKGKSAKKPAEKKSRK